MSGIHIGYEIGRGGGGEVTSYQESILNSKNILKSAHVIAGEIVKEIVENASDIAIGRIGKIREEIKTPCCSSSKMSDIQIDNICSNIIGNIVEDTGIQSPPKISTIIEELNNLSVNQKSKDAVPIVADMKKMLGEMLSPPYEIINHDVSLVKGGVGDQPNVDTLVNEVVYEPEVQKPIEKKSRVTDLVKNSPHIISEYLNIENQTKQSQEDWEETEEHLLQVIELDCVMPDKEWFSMHKNINEKDVVIPNYDGKSNFIITDVTNIMNDNIKKIQKDLQNMAELSEGGKDNKFATDTDNTNDNVSFRDAGTSGEKLLDISEILKQSKTQSLELKEQKTKKKKPNFARRLFEFFCKGRKSSKHDDSTCSQ